MPRNNFQNPAKFEIHPIRLLRQAMRISKQKQMVEKPVEGGPLINQMPEETNVV